jgi:hypothetical protein
MYVHVLRTYLGVRRYYIRAYTYYVRGSWGPCTHVQAPSGDPGLIAAVIEGKEAP